MKKLVFMFVAIAAISFASCGNKTTQASDVDSVNVNDSDLVNDSNVVANDSNAVAQ